MEIRNDPAPKMFFHKAKGQNQIAWEVGFMVFKTSVLEPQFKHSNR
jgi:hypothetical protein